MQIDPPGLADPDCEGDARLVTQGIRYVRRNADALTASESSPHPFGVDTVRMRLPGLDCWELNTALHGLTVYPVPVYSPADRASREEEGKDAQPVPGPLFYEGDMLIEGGRAQAQTDRVHVSVGPGGVLTLQTSLPKLLRADNRVPVWGEDEMDRAAKMLRAELALLGIDADLDAAILSRLDLARDVSTRYAEHVYVPMLQNRLNLSRQRPAGQYPTSYTVGNTQHRTRFYGKLEEMQTSGHDVSGYAPQLRAEHQMNKRRVISSTIGIDTFPALLACPTSAVEGYQTQMLSLFKTEPATSTAMIAASAVEQPTPSIMLTEQAALDVFRTCAEKYPRGWMDKGLASIGLATAEKQGAIPLLFDAIRKVGEEMNNANAGRQAASRARSRRDDLAGSTAALDVELAQIAALYAEVRGALLSAV